MIHFDIPKLETELKELEDKTIQDGFWNDQKNSNKVLAEIKNRKGKVTKFKELLNELNNIKELIDLVEMEDPPELPLSLSEK